MGVQEGLAPMVVDDPHTTAPADYWLHPCECAPAAWGMEKPVNPESFESVPGKSGNSCKSEKKKRRSYKINIGPAGKIGFVFPFDKTKDLGP